MGHNYKPQISRLDFENEYLVLHSLQLSWNEANDMCDSAGQHLSSITNENIDHFFNLPLGIYIRFLTSSFAVVTICCFILLHLLSKFSFFFCLELLLYHYWKTTINLRTIELGVRTLR